MGVSQIPFPSERAGRDGRFGEEVLELCRMLEGWRKSEQLVPQFDPNEFPEINWRDAARCLTLFALGGLVVLTQSWLHFVNGAPTLALFIGLLALCGIGGQFLMLRALGIFKRRFWRAARLRKLNNYPFTSLVRRTQRDLTMTAKLAGHSEIVLVAVQERFTLVENELRERLTLLGGNSPIPTIIGLAAGSWSAWKSLQGQVSIVLIGTLGVSVAVILVTAYTFNLRFSLLELARCRGLLSLELARRKAG